MTKFLHVAMLNAQLIELAKKVTGGLEIATPSLPTQDARDAARSMVAAAKQVIALAEEQEA